MFWSMNYFPFIFGSNPFFLTSPLWLAFCEHMLVFLPARALLVRFV